MNEEIFEKLKKIINEKNKINKKIQKNYKWIIISIIILALGLMLPGFLVSRIAWLSDFTKVIDGAFMLITGRGEIITPLIYIGLFAGGIVGTVLNIVKLVQRKIKLIGIELEEKTEIREIGKIIKGETLEKEKAKEESKEVTGEIKDILIELKNDMLNTRANNSDNKMQIKTYEENLGQEKVKERTRK